MSNFLYALKIVLEWEGGDVDNPLDPGGHTNQGITQTTYDNWRDAVKEPRRSVSLLEPHETSAIYFAYYWKLGRCESLPWPISLYHFDACVNHGLKAGIKVLQRAAGTKEDGIFGPKTLAAATALDPEDFLWVRAEHYSTLKGFGTWGRNWLIRLIRLRRFRNAV